MEFEPEQSGLGAGHRIGAQRLLRPGNDLFGSDGLDPDVKRAGLARRIDARLDQPHIFIEDRVLGGDPEREDAVEPALDRRQLFEERDLLVSELEIGHGMEARSEERRVGIGSVSKCRSVWRPYNTTKKTTD